MGKAVAKKMLNPEQDARLRAYAAENGKGWKQKLLDQWLNGSDASLPDGHLLRQIRNHFGPSWLDKWEAD